MIDQLADFFDVPKAFAAIIAMRLEAIGEEVVVAKRAGISLADAVNDSRRYPQLAQAYFAITSQLTRIISSGMFNGEQHLYIETKHALALLTVHHELRLEHAALAELLLFIVLASEKTVEASKTAPVLRPGALNGARVAAEEELFITLHAARSGRFTGYTRALTDILAELAQTGIREAFTASVEDDDRNDNKEQMQ